MGGASIASFIAITIVRNFYCMSSQEQPGEANKPLLVLSFFEEDRQSDAERLSSTHKGGVTLRKTKIHAAYPCSRLPT